MLSKTTIQILLPLEATSLNTSLVRAEYEKSLFIQSPFIKDNPPSDSTRQNAAWHKTCHWVCLAWVCRVTVPVHLVSRYNIALLQGFDGVQLPRPLELRQEDLLVQIGEERVRVTHSEHYNILWCTAHALHMHDVEPENVCNVWKFFILITNLVLKRYTVPFLEYSKLVWYLTSS